ncbi:hypothetical protein B7494_g293 [Chlorociboria aeruginascens]|nr:hypothetical protein B7494_g293 [Chlorociboria aeruginascens]
MPAPTPNGPSTEPQRPRLNPNSLASVPQRRSNLELYLAEIRTDEQISLGLPSNRYIAWYLERWDAQWKELEQKQQANSSETGQ